MFKALDKIPTHDVVLVCSLSWEMINGANGELSLMPSINKIRHIEADRQDFATKAEWNKKLTKCAYNIEDDEVDFEESEEQQIGVSPKNCCFSIFFRLLPVKKDSLRA